jgi:DNA-binding SARP family transcriptional activator
MGQARLYEDALDAARAAARAADFRCDPYLRILTHTALYILSEASRPVEAALLSQLVVSFESVEMKEAVAALVRGESPGILDSFVHRRVMRVRESAQPRLVIEILVARATLDGTPIRLTEKELEFLAFVATTPGALTRDRIGEALWGHLDPKGWRNNLKVTLSRVRSKLGSYDAVLSTDGRYRLSPAIEVDLRRAEALVRERQVRPIDERTREALRAILATHRSSALGSYERFAWAQPMLARIHSVICTAGSILAEDALTQGRFDEALEYAEAITAIDPYDESACELSIRVLLARGELSAARREFRRYAAALAEGLDAKPSAHLSTLVGMNLKTPVDRPRSGA